jgi:tetratricopeptide (TPR) repeat protein
VSAGENFRISYTVNTQDVDNFRIGKVPGGLEVIAGPYTSQQSSFQMVNGHTSSSSSITYTYIIYAEKNGNYTIGSATAKIGGKTIHSRGINISVAGRTSNHGGAPQMHDDEENEPQMKTAGSKITGKDLFIKVSANKSRVHEQEPILLTYKVYTLVDLTQLEGKMPDLTGFHTQEVPLPQQKSFHIEKVGGRNYRCVTWSQYVMYPQMTGKLTIPSITFKGIVVQQNRSVDPFEAFFNGGSGYVEVKHNVKAPSITVQVDPLPQRPTNFSGGVGKFNISAQINHATVKAGNPISMRIVIGGNGNLKLIKQPILNLPKDFDSYDPKITDKTKLTANGLEGNMIYDYLIVPRNQGSYTLPPVEFTYYDTQANAYKTIKTKPFNITVEKGDGKSGDIDDYSEKRNDIIGLKKGNTTLHDVNDFFYGSGSYMASIIIPLIIFAVLVFFFRKRALNNADIVKMRAGKANKVAAKRLKKANSLMQKGKHGEFYDEVLKALWGYVGDKLNMPAEKLSRENIEENLSAHDVDTETIKTFIEAIDECEYERYAPGDPAGNMSKTFNSAMTAIMDIENALKMRKKRKHATIEAIVILLMTLIPAQSFGITKENADTEYTKGNYQQAIKDYKEILQKGVSADIYYNLGNAYFRTDSITQAVLAYERALMLQPGDEDIKFNLQFARSKTIDKITPESEMFFVTWYKQIVNYTSVDNWAKTSVFAFILSLALIMVYLMSSRINLRKVGFYGAVASMAVFLIANIFAYQQKTQLENRTGAIVISPSAGVKKTPSKGNADEFVIHEGTRVDILDKTISGWRNIRLEDGREGWIRTKQIEEI